VWKNSRRTKKDGHGAANDLDSSELAVRSQCVGSAASGAVTDPALSSTAAVPGTAARQRTQQSRTKVGKRRSVACLDGPRPRRPVQQTVNACWLSTTTTSSMNPGTSSPTADISDTIADVIESTALPPDGNNCVIIATKNLSVFYLLLGHYTGLTDSPTLVPKMIHITWTCLKISDCLIDYQYYNFLQAFISNYLHAVSVMIGAIGNHCWKVNTVGAVTLSQKSSGGLRINDATGRFLLIHVTAVSFLRATAYML